MTKSKKMKKSTFAVVIMAILMVAMLAFGGTYAYFTATANGPAGTAKTGHVKLSADGEYTLEATNAVPGDALLEGQVSFVNASNVDTFVVAKTGLKFSGKVWSTSATTPESLDDYTDETNGTLVGSDATAGYFYNVTDMPVSAFTLETDKAMITAAGISADWEETAQGSNIYVYKANGYKVAANSTTAVGLFADDAAYTLSVDAAGHYANEVYTETRDGAIVWEDATIVVTVSFQQVQYANHAGLDYEALSAASIYEEIASLLK